MGTRARAHRNIGGMANVVTSAIATMIVNKILAERAHGKADAGDDDFGGSSSIHAAADRECLTPGQAADRASHECAAKLAEARNRNDAECHGRHRGIFQNRHIRGKTLKHRRIPA